MHIPVRESHQRFLRFTFDRNSFQHNAVPFGLKSSPRVFTKILLMLMAFFFTQGVSLPQNLDNLLIKAPDTYQCQEAMAVTATCLKEQGLITNKEKSVLYHSRAFCTWE